MLLAYPKSPAGAASRACASQDQKLLHRRPERQHETVVVVRSAKDGHERTETAHPFGRSPSTPMRSAGSSNASDLRLPANKSLPACSCADDIAVDTTRRTTTRQRGAGRSIYPCCAEKTYAALLPFEQNADVVTIDCLPMRIILQHVNQ